LHAAFATDTAAIVEIYDSIRTAEEGVGGTNLNAGSIVAVVTSHHAEVAPGLRELAGLHVFHPCSKDSDGDLVFLLARHRAGVTADTSILVDNEPVAHKRMAAVLISLPRGPMEICLWAGFGTWLLMAGGSSRAPHGGTS